MLPRSRRLSTRALRGARWQHETRTPFFIVRWTSPKKTPGRYAVSVPLRVSKNAPVRNNVRRAVFAALRAYAPQCGSDAFFIISSRALNRAPQELETAIKGFIERTTTPTP